MPIGPMGSCRTSRTSRSASPGGTCNDMNGRPWKAGRSVAKGETGAVVEEYTGTCLSPGALAVRAAGGVCNAPRGGKNGAAASAWLRIQWKLKLFSPHMYSEERASTRCSCCCKRLAAIRPSQDSTSMLRKQPKQEGRAAAALPAAPRIKHKMHIDALARKIARMEAR